MKIHATLTAALLALLLSAARLPAQDKGEATTTGLPLGMARADDPQQVAILYSERHRQRVEAIHKAAEPDRLHPQEAYTQKLAAYRSQLVEEQHQRKLKELELAREREATQRAEKEALKAELEHEREVAVYHHHAVHAYHRWIRNRDCWQRQWREAICKIRHPKRCNEAQPSPQPSPQPQPQPNQPLP